MEKNNLPRGVRNNNPLNIRYVARNHWFGRVKEKKDSAFEEFTEMRYGFRAAFILLHRYIYLEKRNTILAIISKWAPVEDNNDTLQYAQFVAGRCNVGIYTPIDFKDCVMMQRLVLAMAKFENGQDLSKVDALLGYCAACLTLGYNVVVDETE